MGASASTVCTLSSLICLAPLRDLILMQSRAGLQLVSFFPCRIAVVSDEACGSGNYTVQMSLRPVAEASPELQGSALPQDTFLASLAMRSSSSQPVLRVRSCCVTPSSSPGGPGAVCCLLPRYGMGMAWAHPSAPVPRLQPSLFGADRGESGENEPRSALLPSLSAPRAL